MQDSYTIKLIKLSWNVKKYSHCSLKAETNYHCCWMVKTSAAAAAAAAAAAVAVHDDGRVEYNIYESLRSYL